MAIALITVVARRFHSEQRVRVVSAMAMLRQRTASPLEHVLVSEKICKHEAANRQPDQSVPISRHQCIHGVTGQVNAEDRQRRPKAPASTAPQAECRTRTP